MIALPTLNKPITKIYLLLLFSAACLVRAITFYAYIQHEERYRQADSNDYHNATMCMFLGSGMHRPDTKEPIFWRTPGYPCYILPFYRWHKPTTTKFNDASQAQKASIWFQIFLSGFIPIILLYLALLLTHSMIIAHITAWLSVIHLGMVLTSTYFLTEGTSIILFYIFLFFFYRSITLSSNKAAQNFAYSSIIWAAINLGLYTWFRPMGLFVAILCALIILLFSMTPWHISWKKILLFLCTFFICLSPWYIRNYRLTGEIFFCPMSGPYLNSFCAPRILAQIKNINLNDAFKITTSQANITYFKESPKVKQRGLYLPREFICSQIAWPIVLAYPWLALYDWMREVFKTTFDLYASQLVAFVKKCQFCDPMIEYLSEKIQECLYQTPMSWPMRLIVYLELIYALLLWVGLFGGLWLFIWMPLYCRLKIEQQRKNLFHLWIMVLPMIGGALFMTGGFGYARLRLPIEPLMIILSLTFWLYVWQQKNKPFKQTEIL